MSSLRFINKKIHSLLCRNCEYLSSYSAACVNDVFVIISQVLWFICFPPRSVLDISDLNSFMHYPLSTDMHLSDAQTQEHTVLLNYKGLRVLWCFVVVVFLCVLL